MKIALFLDIIGRDEAFSEHGLQGVSAAAGLKSGQSNRKRDPVLAEFIKKRISNIES